MDADRAELIARLLTLAGGMMEDASTVSILSSIHTQEGTKERSEKLISILRGALQLVRAAAVIEEIQDDSVD